MPVYRSALLVLALCVLCTQCVRAQQHPESWVSEGNLQTSNDDAFDYPEVIVQAEGAREMMVTAAGAGLEGSQQAYRLIVRFPRSINLGDAVARLMSLPVSQLTSTISAADASGPATLGSFPGVREVRRLRGGAVRGVAVELPAALDATEAIAALMTVQDVQDVEREGIVTVQIAAAPKVAATGVLRDAPLGLLRTGLASMGPDGLKVQATVSQDTSVAIAIVDTGVDSSHPDLRLAGGKDFTHDDNYGLDGNGHGTHVAGIISALNNGAGVVGAVPGAPIWSLKVLSAAGQGTTTGVIDALNWVAENGRANNIRVVNLSLSGPRSRMMCDAVKEVVARGITVVAAAGNNGMEISSGSPSDCTSALVVTAMADYDGKPGGKTQPPKGNGAPTTPDDTAASFSNYALARSSRVLAAPGVHVLSTVPAATCGALKCAKAGPYARLSGTSMAAPLVSGMAALCYNLGECDSQRGSSAGTLYTSIFAASRAARDQGFQGDPNSPMLRKHYGYLAVNPF